MIAKNRLIQEARALPLQERVQLIDELYRSLDEPDPVIEAAIVREAKSRARAYRAGKLKTVPVESVFPELG